MLLSPLVPPALLLRNLAQVRRARRFSVFERFEEVRRRGLGEHAAEEAKEARRQGEPAGRLRGGLRHALDPVGHARRRDGDDRALNVVVVTLAEASQVARVELDERWIRELVDVGRRACPLSVFVDRCFASRGRIQPGAHFALQARDVGRRSHPLPTTTASHNPSVQLL